MGETYRIEEKKASDGASYLAAVTEGVNVAHEGPKSNPLVGTKNWPALAGEYDLSFCPTIYFVETETGQNCSLLSVNSTSQLSAKFGQYGNGAYSRYFGKSEAGVVLEPIEVEFNGQDWLASKEQQEEAYGDSYRYKINPDGFKSAVGEMLKLYIDEVANGMAKTTWQ